MWAFPARSSSDRLRRGGCTETRVSDKGGAVKHGVENLHNVFYRGAFQENTQLEIRGKRGPDQVSGAEVASALVDDHGLGVDSLFLSGGALLVEVTYLEQFLC